MSTSVEQIKERLDIAEVIGSYIKLERAGENLKAKCPFHNERTPSFMVSPKRGSFYCFGCDAKGDMFTFVERFEGLDFKGALHLLADRAGIELAREDPRERRERDTLYELVDEAAKFFEARLSEAPDALGYLEGRGLSREGIQSWRLGYAPAPADGDGWRLLHNHLLKQGYKEPDIERAGLVKRKTGARGEVVYDTFRGRIIFPIFDSAGRPVAFSGRIFPEASESQGAGSPKYLNSPDTPLFIKSKVLYGFDRAKQEIRRRNFAVLVEGQMDLLLSHERGFKNTVATSGTALTREHLGIIKRVSPRVIAAFDADSAGKTAAERHAAQAIELGMEVKVALPDAGKDPADMLKEDPRSWKRVLTGSRHLIDFLLEELVSGARGERELAKAVRDRVLPLVARLPSNVEKDNFVRRIAERANISARAVWEDVKALEKNGARQAGIDEQSTDRGQRGGRNESDRRDPLSSEAYLVGLLLWQEALDDPEIDTKNLRRCLIKINGESGADRLFEKYADQTENLTYKAEAEWGRSGEQDPRKKVDEILARYELDVLRAKVGELEREVKGADSARKGEILAEINTTLKHIDSLKQKANVTGSS